MSADSGATTVDSVTERSRCAGLTLSPLVHMGAIIFVDFWLSRRLGFQPGWFVAALSYTVLSRTLQQPAAHLAAVATLGTVEQS